jgi:glycosyltransferase involved in cell wall biosynthesis
LKILGWGPDLEKWRAWVKERGLSNVDMMGFHTGDFLWRHLRHAHVLLFPIRETIPNLSRCPSKTYAYMQAQRPIITNRVGEVAEVLQERAVYVDPTPEAFAAAIEQMMTPGVLHPDVEYGVESHSWSVRTTTLLARIS